MAALAIAIKPRPYAKSHDFWILILLELELDVDLYFAVRLYCDCKLLLDFLKMDHSPPCGERFNANGGETQPLLLSRSTSGSDVSNSPKLPVPESSSARYGSSLASASASVNHNIHFPEQASDDLFNPQSGHTVATGFSTFKSGVPPSDTSQETTGQ